jgi:cytochrome oxidase Cu insertion factor (SCO1/SenC/PrrC family)
VALATLLLTVTSCGSSSPPAPGPGVGTRMATALPKAITSIPLVDSSGQRRTLADFAGKVLVISDTMTLCQETCPIDTASLVQVAREADQANLAHDVEFLTITVDPQRDTPPQLAAYRALYAPTPSNWLTLTGTPSNVNKLWSYFGVYRKHVADDSPAPTNWRTGLPLTYDVEHSDEVFFIDTAQRERFILEGVPQVANKKEVPAKLIRFLSAEGRQNLAGNSAMIGWTEPQARTVIAWLTGNDVLAKYH